MAKYIIRDSAGNVQYGEVFGEPILVGPNAEVSLNVDPEFVSTYLRRGQDLIITTADGNDIVLQGFFADATGMEHSRLLYSTNGELVEIDFSEVWSRTNVARYNQLDVTGGAGDLVFLSEGEFYGATVVAAEAEVSQAALIGGFGAIGGGGAAVGVGAAGLAIVGAGGLGGGDDDKEATGPDLDLVTPVAGDDVVTAAEAGAGVTLDGTVEEGSTVVVTVGGTDYNATVDVDGNWTVTLPADAFDGLGSPVAIEVTATDGDGETRTVTRNVEVDLVSEAAFSAGDISTDGMINAQEVTDGVAVTGTSEPGSTVEVTLGTVTKTATVDANGNWSATFQGNADIPAGTYTADVTAVATDAAGNTRTLTTTVDVDTNAALALQAAQITGDDLITAQDVSNGVTFGGTTEVGATVMVDMNGVSKAATVAGDGTWTVTFQGANEITSGSYDSTITVTATDAAGNTASLTKDVAVDTVTEVAMTQAHVAADDMINAAERTAGVTITGTAEVGSTVDVQLGTVTKAATVAGNGSWTVTFDAADIPDGEYGATVTATATDPAGNTATATRTVEVDTLATLALQADPVAGDNVVNALEAENGVTITGTAEAGASVDVRFGTATNTLTVGQDGTWSTTFDRSDLPDGDYTTTITAQTTDLAGNTATDTLSVDVDTIGPDPVVFTGYDKGLTTLRGVTTEIDAGTDYTFVEIAADNTIATVAATKTTDQVRGEWDYTFDTPVPDGSRLVVMSEDANGNETGTLFLWDDNQNTPVDLGRAEFDGIDIQAINLQVAPNEILTITEEDLLALSDTADTLTIRGGADDTITAIGAVSTGQTQTIDGQTFDVYTLGNGTLVIDDDINVVTTI